MSSLEVDLQAFLKRLGPYFLKFELEFSASNPRWSDVEAVWSVSVPLTGAYHGTVLVTASRLFLRRAARGLLGIANAEVGDQELALVLSELAVLVTNVVSESLPGDIVPGIPELVAERVLGAGRSVLSIGCQSADHPLQVELFQASGS